VWEWQIVLLVRDHPFDVVMAERPFGQAIAYLITAVEKWGQGLEIGCGELVDPAVHALGQMMGSTPVPVRLQDSYCRRTAPGAQTSTTERA
jgi:hypothetical protein